MREKISVVTRPQIASVLQVSLNVVNILMAMANDGSVGPIRHKDRTRKGAMQTVYTVDSIIEWLNRTCPLRFSRAEETELRSAAFDVEMVVGRG